MRKNKTKKKLASPFFEVCFGWSIF